MIASPLGILGGIFGIASIFAPPLMIPSAIFGVGSLVGKGIAGYKNNKQNKIHNQVQKKSLSDASDFCSRISDFLKELRFLSNDEILLLKAIFITKQNDSEDLNYQNQVYQTYMNLYLDYYLEKY